MNKPAAEQILAVARIELERILKRLNSIRSRHYRENGNYADELAAAIARMEFLLRDILPGLVSPFEAKSGTAVKKEMVRVQ